MPYIELLRQLPDLVAELRSNGHASSATAGAAARGGTRRARIAALIAELDQSRPGPMNLRRSSSS